MEAQSKRHADGSHRTATRAHTRPRTLLIAALVASTGLAAVVVEQAIAPAYASATPVSGQQVGSRSSEQPSPGRKAQVDPAQLKQLPPKACMAIKRLTPKERREIARLTPKERQELARLTPKERKELARLAPLIKLFKPLLKLG